MAKIASNVDSRPNDTDWTPKNPATEETLIKLPGLAIPEHDYIALTYTGDDLTQIVYKSGGAGGTTVATLTLTYTANILQTVTKT